MLRIGYDTQSKISSLILPLRNLSNLLIIDESTDINNFDVMVGTRVATKYYFPNQKYNILVGGNFYPKWITIFEKEYRQEEINNHYWAGNLKFFIIKKDEQGKISYDIKFNIATKDTSTGQYIIDDGILSDEGFVGGWNYSVEAGSLLRYIKNNILNIGIGDNDSLKEEIYNVLVTSWLNVNQKQFLPISPTEQDIIDCSSESSNCLISQYLKTGSSIIDIDSYSPSPTDPVYYISEENFSLLDFYVKMVNYLISKNFIFSFEFNKDYFLKQSISFGNYYKQSVKFISNYSFIPYGKEQSTDTEYFYDVENDDLNSSIIIDYLISKKSGIHFNIENLYTDILNIDLLWIKKIDIIYPENYGINEKINTNLLARDFQTSKKELISFLNETYPEIWNDFFESDAGMLMLDSFSMINDILNNYIDRSQREQFLETMLEDKNIYKYATENGIFIPFGTSSVFEMTYKIPLETMPSGTTTIEVDFSSLHNYKEGQTYSVTDNVLNKNWVLGITSDKETKFKINLQGDETEKYIRVPFKEGEVKTENYILTGIEDESISLTLTNFDLNMLRVYRVDSGVYTELQVDTDWDYFFNEVDIVITRANNLMNLNFGNRVVGYYKKQNGQLNNVNIRLVYLTHHGEEGNGLPENVWGIKLPTNETLSIIEDKPKISITYYDENGNILSQETDKEIYSILNTISRDGESELTQKEMKQYIISQKHKNRIITYDDYVKFTNFFIGKTGQIHLCNPVLYRYGLTSYDDVFTNSESSYFRDANTVLLYTWLNHPDTIYSEWDENEKPLIIQELEKEINKRNDITVFSLIKSGKIMWFDFKVFLENTSIFPFKDIESFVNESINSFFSERVKRPFYFRSSELIYYLNNSLKQKISNQIYVRDILIKNISIQSDWISIFSEKYSKGLLLPEDIVYHAGYETSIRNVFGELIINEQFISDNAKTICESVFIPLPNKIYVNISEMVYDKHNFDPLIDTKIF